MRVRGASSMTSCRLRAVSSFGRRLLPGLARTSRGDSSPKAPPSIKMTPRFARVAAAIASTTARKSRATSTSGSEPTNAENERSSRGGCANSSALTLLGRRATGTVRIAERSASRTVGCACCAIPSSRGEAAWSSRAKGGTI